MQNRQFQLVSRDKLFSAAKWTVVTAVSAALLTATALPASAGYTHKPSSGGKTVNKITKRVTAKAGNKNQFNGNSNSKAKVNNSINVNVGGGHSGGGGRVVLNRGGSHNNNNGHKNNHKNNNNGNNGDNNKKKVIRKVVNNIVTYEIVDSYNTIDSYNTTTVNETKIIDSYNTDITNIEDSYNKYYCPTCYAPKGYHYPKSHGY